MRLIRKEEHQCLFYLNGPEQELLFDLLRRYPCIPPAHHNHTRLIPRIASADAQQLLEESLEEHRTATRRQLQAWLADPNRMHKKGNGYEIAVTFPELEQLLQVLNDIRVGSWVALGEPDEKIQDLPPGKSQNLWFMELAGIFQMRILEAMGS